MPLAAIFLQKAAGARTPLRLLLRKRAVPAGRFRRGFRRAEFPKSAACRLRPEENAPGDGGRNACKGRNPGPGHILPVNNRRISSLSYIRSGIESLPPFSFLQKRERYIKIKENIYIAEESPSAVGGAAGRRRAATLAPLLRKGASAEKGGETMPFVNALPGAGEAAASSGAKTSTEMLFACWAIVIVLLAMELVFLRARKKEYAVAILPLLITPAVYIVSGVVSGWLSGFLSLAAGQIRVIIDLTAGMVSCLLLGLASRGIAERRTRNAFFWCCAGFVLILTLALVTNTLAAIVQK